MIYSKHATKFTKMHQAGKSNPEVDMENRKASERPIRIQMWKLRQERINNAAKAASGSGNARRAA